MGAKHLFAIARRVGKERKLFICEICNCADCEKMAESGASIVTAEIVQTYPLKSSAKTMGAADEIIANLKKHGLNLGSMALVKSKVRR